MGKTERIKRKEDETGETSWNKWREQREELKREYYINYYI
jgi:hypothetical protein